MRVALLIVMLPALIMLLGICFVHWQEEREDRRLAREKREYVERVRRSPQYQYKLAWEQVADWEKRFQSALAEGDKAHEIPDQVMQVDQSGMPVRRVR